MIGYLYYRCWLQVTESWYIGRMKGYLAYFICIVVGRSRSVCILPSLHIKDRSRLSLTLLAHPATNQLFIPTFRDRQMQLFSRYLVDSTRLIP